MSFRDIRASRASRQPKSYILPAIGAQAAFVGSIKHPPGRNPQDSRATEAVSRLEEGQTIETSDEVVTQDSAAQKTGPCSSHSIKSSAGQCSEGETDGTVPNLVVPDASSSVRSLTDWYAELPPTLSIKRSKKRGRGLWTKVGITAGTILISVRPHVHVLSRSQLECFCTSCCAPPPSTGLKKCTKCKTVYYCGPTCQTFDWPTHKLECEALQKWAASAPSELNEGDHFSVPPEAVRSLGRIIWRRKKLGSSSTWWNEINEMQSHHDNLAPSMVDAFVHLAHALALYIGIESKHDLEKYEVHGVGELVGLISKFTSNSFTLTTPSLSPIGVSVSPIAALINHSCDPNVAVVFPRSTSSTLQEPVLQVIAIQDIPPDTELFTSYVDVTLPTTQRQKDLRETYNFTCACSVCSPPQDAVVEDWRERMWCPKDCGGTCPIPVEDSDVVRCAKCQAITRDTEKVVDMLRVGQEALDKATALQFSEPDAALRLTQNMISMIVSTRIAPSAHPLLALHRLRQSLLISTLPENASKDQLDETIRAAATSVAGLSSVLRPGHPVRAVALAELGKLLAVDEPSSDSNITIEARHSSPLLSSTDTAGEKYPPTGAARLQLAVQTLRQAHAELLVAFGRDGGGGEVGRAVREMLVGLEKELGVWRGGIRDALGDALAERKGAGASASLSSKP